MLCPLPGLTQRPKEERDSLGSDELLSAVGIMCVGTEAPSPR